MLRFLLGFVLALTTVAGCAYVYLGKRGLTDPCLARCDTGTICKGHTCIAAPVIAPPPPEPKPGRRRRTRTHVDGNGVAVAEPEKKLLPGDEKINATGDALGRPEHIDMSEGGDDGKSLSQDEIDRVWKGVEPALSRCITEAVADWPLEGGKIEVSYRIERDGGVKKVRLVAPQLLLRNGLYACMRGKITATKFPRSGGANVVTFPFQLQ